jgi:hypothetical protein
MIVVVTVTAPIRLPAKTAAALKERIASLVAGGAEVRNRKATIHGNRVRMRLLANPSKRWPRLVGFVHNRGVDPGFLLDSIR